MLKQLTQAQHGTLWELQRMKLKALALMGMDLNEDPVVYIHDARRRFPMAIHKDGSGGTPSLPVRAISSEEIAALSGEDQDRLLCMEEIGPVATCLREIWDPPREPPERNTDTTWPEPISTRRSMKRSSTSG